MKNDPRQSCGANGQRTQREQTVTTTKRNLMHTLNAWFVCYTSLPMPFAIVDRAREGTGAVLMIVDERLEAETIAIELRDANVSVDVQPVAADWVRQTR